MTDPVHIGDATLYLGDCRDILPTLSGVDAVVTDPPYGIDLDYGEYKDTLENWKDLMLEVVPMMRRFPCVVMPSCQIRLLEWWYQNFPPDWLIAWYKGSPGHAAYVGFNDWEPHLIWGKPAKPIHDYFRTPLNPPVNGHPCPKPIEYSLWLCDRMVDKSQTILDPFMGSGTTGVACARLGRKFIGCEIEKKYFDISVERIKREYDQMKLF